jgi:hypothetical protein
VMRRTCERLPHMIVTQGVGELRREHVVTDSAGAVIAAVLRRGTRTDAPPGWDRDDCAIILGKPGDAPALVISSDGMDSRRAKVWVASDEWLGNLRQLGTLRSTFWLGALRYTDGASPKHEGRVRPRRGYYVPNNAWTVIDAGGSEHAHIARRLPAQPERRQSADKVFRGQLVWWSRPVACEVIESGPDFDWIEHGLLVALAALCDRLVRLRAFPRRGGGF